MSDAVPPPRGQEQPAANSTCDSTHTANGSDISRAKEWFKAVLKIQHSAISQAQEDRHQALEGRQADWQIILAAHQASADCIGQLEDLLLVMNIKTNRRAQTLQSLFNFNSKKFSKLGDLQLAQFVLYGLPNALQDRMNKRQLLEASPFAYRQFEKQANASFLVLHCPMELPPLAKSNPNAPPTLGRNEFIWQVHAYLDLQGLCHFCKKHCRNATGSCPGPIERSHINIPNNFQTPIKPPNYIAPCAWGKEVQPTSLE
ncbi:uncharacterized protein PGTG_14026 [Puccinia graminis f. sp. tritici CRL 75-36-700-3]|uniref:Uncharacterized protein n=1 Tax=Puccinia graminis f. sp. tritici (strain CRL 75-36-700-3 / race SCCL) TaxID=418459 RepID=E3KVX3_PUCGT|nr:uncharacterized protein PGTG_14026 [Puccinia graminis f. sp. tritici CRL 75-36-700-3]EFP88448.1 hypothetical protein PGTG_14026 [Puccinia graminis f. sp. tritici CRL 75-36-700-3]